MTKERFHEIFNAVSNAEVDVTDVQIAADVLDLAIAPLEDLFGNLTDKESYTIDQVEARRVMNGLYATTRILFDAIKELNKDIGAAFPTGQRDAFEGE